jgi:hypothetical protein
MTLDLNELTPRFSKLCSVSEETLRFVFLIPSEDSSAGHQRLGRIIRKAALYCVSCWWKQPKPQRAVVRIGDDGTWHLRALLYHAAMKKREQMP